MEQEVRNKLRNVVTKCRKLLEESIGEQLQGQFGIHANGKVEDESSLSHLGEEDIQYRRDILDHLDHIKALGYKSKDALAQLVREIAFTHLNRFCAYKMMAARDVQIGGKRFRDAVGKGLKSQGFLFYLADHPDDEKLFNSGKQDAAYRHFLDWLGTQLSEEIGVLFNSNDPANRLYPPQRVLDDIFDLLNGENIKEDEIELRKVWPEIWSQDETIGWVYQYFNSKEFKDKIKKESAAPRNSHELAVRNQFFTPRYVVEFLTDNTLARIWYEMRRGETRLVDECQYLVRCPNEVFLAESEQPPPGEKDEAHYSQEELLRQPIYIPHRPKKDPRDLRILDPACGSGHFLLYCFDLLLTIYDEAYDDADLGPALRDSYPDKVEYERSVPGLILSKNLHGVDIDLRASQIAALALWLRCQRFFKDTSAKNRPPITRSHFVCAESMPGSKEMLTEFASNVHPKIVGQLVQIVFEKMQLAGEAGSLLRIHDDLRGAIAKAKEQWLAAPTETQLSLFDDVSTGAGTRQHNLFDVSGISDDQFWSDAESKVLHALENYADATSVEHRLGKRLFAQDAARGFAFIDLGRAKYDVLLMNPPFGAPSAPIKTYLAAEYGNCKEDIDATFVYLGKDLLGPNGMLGAIINRTQFFKKSLRTWREELFLGGLPIRCCTDLGYGVLDGALVEAAAYTLHKSSCSDDRPAIFLRTLRSQDKGAGLREQIESVSNDSRNHDETFVNDIDSFRSIPESRIAYWATAKIRDAFKNMASVEKAYGKAQVGVSTKRDFQFLRLIWEVPVDKIATDKNECLVPVDVAQFCWVPLAKGGEYAPYFGDLHLVIDWTDSGLRISEYLKDKYPYLKGNVGWVMHPESDYFEPGITYTRRTTSGFSPRFLPAGCIFGELGRSFITAPRTRSAELLALLMSRTVAGLVELLVESGDAVSSGSAARTYESNVTGGVPVPNVNADAASQLRLLVESIWRTIRDQNTRSETSRYFVSPISGLKSDNISSFTLQEAAERLFANDEDGYLKTLEMSFDIESRVRRLYGFDAETLQLIDDEMGLHPCARASTNHSIGSKIRSAYENSLDSVIDDEVQRSGGSRIITKKVYFADRRIEVLCEILQCHPRDVIECRRKAGVIPADTTRQFVADIISYLVGVAFGRWSTQHFASFDLSLLPGPLDALPKEPPAASDGNTGDADGILVCDADHADDIVKCVFSGIDRIWNRQATLIEQETCDILGVSELRDYFAKSGKGGFWDEHQRKYSKSRRKAPVYWLLQSSKRNYSVWLYYHRLDRDMLFKVLSNYVDPKIRRENNRLTELRAKKDSRANSAGELRKVEREIEKQEAQIDEIVTFAEKLRKVADLRLNPDLNDGVVLNIAPLYELVPWKDAKKYWEQLVEGEYEWSSIGKQLREKGLVQG